jgi:hypothetical protein
MVRVTFTDPHVWSLLNNNRVMEVPDALMNEHSKLDTNIKLCSEDEWDAYTYLLLLCRYKKSTYHEGGRIYNGSNKICSFSSLKTRYMHRRGIMSLHRELLRDLVLNLRVRNQPTFTLLGRYDA